LTVPSSIIAGRQVVFARCRRCDCRFVLDYRPAAYDQTPGGDAPLRFYVEQGAGIEFLARSLFVAAQKPVRNYLDVGCGFGFGPDMASRILGWDALGLDPGPLADAGREMLGIRIESDHLSAGVTLSGAPYDSIVALEVIEHVADPHDFVAALRRHVSATGIVVLSTPNGRYLDTCPDGAMLMPVLSPGYHAVLYTAEGLAALLRKAGFSAANVVPTQAALFAVASPERQPLQADIGINEGRYIAYLRARFSESTRDSPIYIGFGYRLLRHLVARPAYDEALLVFTDLREAIQVRLGIDIARPLDVASDVLEAELAFADVPKKYPFCLAGLLHCRGTIAASYERSKDIAAACFLAARFAANMLLRSLQAIGISDGDLVALPALAAGAMKIAVESRIDSSSFT
jgi:SAM-dependent methyltransferase